MPIPGRLMTTAMAVMPHTDVERALALALSLDVPYWPQLPNANYYEDMYVQAAEHFPGILLDIENRKLGFSMDKFIEELEPVMERMDDPAYMDISKTYSVVYHRFLASSLEDRPAIRGQLEGPISFGFNVLDQNDRPILFDETVRPFMFEFMARRVNAQLARLKKKNTNAFMFIDEPGLQFLFSALAGYGDRKAKADMDDFFAMLERPRGIHLCGNPDWDFLLGLDLDILSLDIYTNAEVFASYAPAVRRFLDRGGVIVWGIVPTNVEPFERESLVSLESQIEKVWDTLVRRGVDRENMLLNSMLSPATCCLVNPDRERTVDKAFDALRRLSLELRQRHGLL